jgi:hypothetical protein
MILTPRVYYSINPATSAYQGRVLAFIGDQRAMKEPNPVCMPITKTWEWFLGNAVTNFAAFKDQFAVKASRNNLWTPVAGEDTSGATQVPHLLAIPNILVDLLCTQGTAIMPHEVLMTVDDFIGSSPHFAGPQWECIWKWCLVAGQSGANRKSKVFLETSPITIDDNDFDRWVRNHLDISLGPRPRGSPQATAGPAGDAVMDYSALSRMLAMTIGTTMIHNQAVAPQGGGQGLLGNKTALSTGKRFNLDQIAKLKEACGINNVQQIPAIWSVIQATKGKSFNSYRAHLAKSVDAWCCSHHIDRDKSIFLKAKFFEDLVALRFNPGGPVAQYQLVVQGMSMLACHSLTASGAEYCRDYKEAAASTINTHSLDDLLKWNHGKTVAPAATYMDLKLNIGTCCGLLWTIFGDDCDYYKELLKIYHTLDCKECFFNSARTHKGGVCLHDMGNCGQWVVFLWAGI